MMTVPLIAFTGCAGSGKDLAAHHICTMFKMPVYALANPVKKLSHIFTGDVYSRSDKESIKNYRMTCEKLVMLNYTYMSLQLHKYTSFESFYEYMHSSLCIELNTDFYASPRLLYQIIGTHWGRSLNPDIWINMAPKNHIISDIRFNNEAEHFKDLGYIIIKMDRNTESIDHESEKGIDKKYIDYTIYNNGSIHELTIVLNDIIMTLKSL